MFEFFVVSPVPYGGYGRTLSDLLSSFPCGIPMYGVDNGPDYSRVGLDQAKQIGDDIYRAYGTETGRDENFPHFAGRGI